MTFWLDRFKKEDEEDIWEELKQMLLNPPSEQEIALKKQQEQADIDAVLEKMFADDMQPNNNNVLGNLQVPTQKTIPGGIKSTQNNFENTSADMVNNIEGFGNILSQGKQAFSKKNEFPDLGRKTDLAQESFAPVNGENGKMYLRNPKQTEPHIDLLNNTKNNVSKPQKEQYLAYEDLLPEETESERKAREARELEAFNKAWDKANGVEDIKADKNGTLTGAASEIKKTNKNNLTWQENFLDGYLRNAELIKNNYPISSNMYTDARTDFSKARTDKNAMVLDNMNSLDPKTVEALKKYGVNTNEKGVYYNFDSNVSKKFGKSDELKKAVEKSLADKEKGKLNNGDLNFNAKLSDAILNKEKFDRYSSIQHAKLIDAYVDEQGQKHGRLIDNYDFNKRPDTLKNVPNNHGYSLQEKGALENFFTVMDVIIEDEEEKEKLLNKLMKKMQR